MAYLLMDSGQDQVCKLETWAEPVLGLGPGVFWQNSLFHGGGQAAWELLTMAQPLHHPFNSDPNASLTLKTSSQHHPDMSDQISGDCSFNKSMSKISHHNRNV